MLGKAPQSPLEAKEMWKSAAAGNHEASSSERHVTRNFVQLCGREGATTDNSQPFRGTLFECPVARNPMLGPFGPVGSNLIMLSLLESAYFL